MEENIAANHGHVPVFRGRVTELLAPAIEPLGDRAIIIDGTLGAGGHAENFLKTFPYATVIGIDRDSRALAKASQRLEPFGDRFFPVHARFDQFAEVIAEEGPRELHDRLQDGVHGALFDLGVSSMQLDQVERGFAYRVDAPLDMRMDPSSGKTAADILNGYSHGDLARVLKHYGEERFAGKISSAIVKEREKEPFSTSGRLVELLYDVIPAATRRTGGHPAKRTFQALRVEVNQELKALENVIPLMAELLAPQGRMVFLSYQSLEDRIVKKSFKELSASATPPGLPMDLPGTAPKFRLLVRGSEKASQEEINENPRSAPVRLRAIEKIETQYGGQK